MQKKCQEAAAKLPTKSIGIKINVKDPEAVEKGIKDVIERMGRIDVLVSFSCRILTPSFFFVNV